MERILNPEQRMYLILTLVSGMRDGYAGKEEQKTDYQIASRIYANAFTNMIRYGRMPSCEERDGVAFLSLELEGSVYSCPARTVKNIMKSEFAVIEEELPEVVPLLDAEESRLAEGQKGRRRRGRGKAAEDAGQEADSPADNQGARAASPEARKAPEPPFAPEIPCIQEARYVTAEAPVQMPAPAAKEAGMEERKEAEKPLPDPAPGPLSKDDREPAMTQREEAAPEETEAKAPELKAEVPELEPAPEPEAVPVSEPEPVPEVKVSGPVLMPEAKAPDQAPAGTHGAGVVGEPAEEAIPAPAAEPEPEPVREVPKPEPAQNVGAHLFQKKERAAAPGAPAAPPVLEEEPPVPPAPVHAEPERRPAGILSRFIPKSKKQELRNAMPAVQEPAAPDAIPQAMDETPGEWICHTHYVMLQKAYVKQMVGPYVIQVWPTEVIEMNPDKVQAPIFVRAVAPNGTVICRTGDRRTKYVLLEIDQKQFNVFGFWDNGEFVTEVVGVNMTASMYTINDEVHRACPEHPTDAFLDQFRSREPRRPEFFVVPVENVNRGEPLVPIAAFARVGDKNYVINNKGAGNVLRFTYADELSEISGRWKDGKFTFTIRAAGQE